jgi:hypothetical protein
MKSSSNRLGRSAAVAVCALLAFLAYGCTSPTKPANATTDGGLSDAGAFESDGRAADSSSSSASRPGSEDGSVDVHVPDGDSVDVHVPEGGGVVGNPPDGSSGWVNVTSNLANMDSECGNLMLLSAKPDEDLLIAGIAKRGLFASGDGGGTWTALGTGAGSAAIDHRPTSIVYDPQNSNRWWESGIYGTTQGVYVTADDGVTFAGLGTIAFNDAASVDFTDPMRRTLLAGAHETPQELWRSTDQGLTWTNIGATLPAGPECPNSYVVDGQTYLVGCNKNGPGVYRTEDGANSWTMVTQGGGSFAPLLASDGSIYWASTDGTMVRSTDQGKTWATTIGPGTLSWVAPVELPDGRIATLANDHVVLSKDHGVTWTPVSPALPQTTASGGDGWFGLVYSKEERAFLSWYWSCGNGSVPVPGDAIQKFAFDYTTQ